MTAYFFEYPFAWFNALFFSMPRLLAFFSILPMLSKQALPGLLRIGVASSFAIFIVPMLIDQSQLVSRTGVMILGIILKEAMIGFVLGFIVALPIWAFDIMGAYVDNQRGASIAATINPLTGHDTSPLGEIFSHAAIVFLMISGGFLLILGALYDSYVMWPVFEWTPKFSYLMPQLLLAQMDRLMTLAVLFSAPVIFTMFLAEVGLGLVSRFVPQLQVFFMAMPIKSGLAMFVFALYTSTLFGYGAVEFEAIGQKALYALSALFEQKAAR
jgi:type III secretion protein T